ncbi:MBOAT family protein [Pigmentiphaga aceris]|uniref:Probable alginate O-acetylase AlgI n=1 Tax=Pigmentiphaga aceris TaxID=1940612 RepID=A0A5C0B0K7_9BURK|nr:MBOAT family protein [Pigmentiphaga aceris]QEI07414.1 MBOAT family protein [Pigmentiphaga aceris]
MVFASLEFLTLFLPAFLVLYTCTPKTWRNTVLMLSSWVFYAWWSPAFLTMLVGLTVLAWLGGMALARSSSHKKRAKYLLVALLTINLGLLCWYKYVNIVVAHLNELIGWLGATPVHWQKVVLPLGLSFIVLQAISYLVDVYRGTIKPSRHFIDFAAYTAMFGQLIAGPIVRYAWVDKDLVDRKLTWLQFTNGARRFMIGMSMKVLVADTLAPVVDIAFSQSNPSFTDAWIGCLAFNLQLFFDFAGYSAMAIGLGLMLGFHFPENFNNPYIARNIQDFWRRWHMSLSSWLRDYLYFPLGGSRNGELRTYVNLMLTMAIAGLWHGSDSWNFLLWGLAHGVAQCAQRLWERLGLPAWPAIPAHVFTLLFVCLTRTVFRAPDWSTASTMYAAQFGFSDFALGDPLRLELRWVHALAASIGVAAILFPVLRQRWEFAGRPSASALGYVWPAVGFLLAFSLIASRGAVPFLYFQF